MFKLKNTVFVREGNYGWMASFSETDAEGNTVYTEVRLENQSDMPTEEGLYEISASRGFKKYTGKTGKVSIYANGNVEFERLFDHDTDLSVEV